MIRHVLTNPKPYIKEVYIIEQNGLITLIVDFVNGSKRTFYSSQNGDANYWFNNVGACKKFYRKHFLSFPVNIWECNGVKQNEKDGEDLIVKELLSAKRRVRPQLV